MVKGSYVPLVWFNDTCSFTVNHFCSVKHNKIKTVVRCEQMCKQQVRIDMLSRSRFVQSYEAFGEKMFVFFIRGRFSAVTQSFISRFHIGWGSGACIPASLFYTAELAWPSLLSRSGQQVLGSCRLAQLSLEGSPV